MLVMRVGVLLLSSTIWVQSNPAGGDSPLQGWELTMADLHNIQQQYREIPRCFNAHFHSRGSVAVIYHRSTFRAISAWIADTSSPFDHMYGDLSRAGIPVRAAQPFLAVANVSKPSKVAKRKALGLQQRAPIHRWPLKNMCLPDSTPLLKLLEDEKL
jgi:hypothetical protein